MDELVLVRGSVHDIPSRLCEIDDRYEIYYNRVLSRYELHARGMYPSLQLIIPYDRLDKRAVDYVRMTRIENQAQAMLSIDSDNERLVARRTNAMLDEAKYKLSSLMRYIDRGGETLPSYEEI